MESDSAVLLFLALGILIISARLGGSLARRLQQPRVLGELIVGILLGPTLLDVLHSPALGLDQANLGESIHTLAELGVLLLLFNIGLEVHLHELTRVGRTAAIAGIAGAFGPVVTVFLLVLLFGYPWQSGLFAGVTLAATSVSISAQVLLELGVLRTRVGNGLLATALIDDVIAILLVSVAVAITQAGGSFEAGPLTRIMLRIAVYLVVAFSIAWLLLPRLMHWIEAHPELAHSYGVPAIALVMALLFGWSAEQFGGVAAITGAFIAGVGLSRTNDAVKHQIESAVANLAYAFLVPIFFVSIGLRTDLRSFPLAALPLAAALLAAAVVSKLLGCGLGAHWGGFSRQEALQLGMCMIPRGEVDLIILSLASTAGVIQTQDPLFSSLFLVIILTTILAPPLVRRVFQPASAVQAEKV